MKNIWKIFTTDLKGLIKNPLAMIVAGGLCILPSLYAWFNIYSNWDPYANTANIKVAVATEDAGYTLRDGTYENMGDEVLEELKENDKIGWVFTETADEALEGVNSGEYYAAVIISENFTYSMYNVFKEDFANPTITYYENEKRNAVATKITDTAVSTLKQSINTKFIEVVTNSIFTETNLLSEDLEDRSRLEVFEEKLTGLNENLTDYSKLIDSFLAANETLSDAVAEANDSIPDLSAKVTEIEGGFSGAKSSLNNTQASLASFSQNVQQTLDGIKASIDRIALDINNTNLAAGAQQTADALNQTVSDTKQLKQQLEDLRNGMVQAYIEERLPEQATDVYQKIVDDIDSLGGSAQDIENTLGGLVSDASGTIVADSVNAAVGGLTQVLGTCSQSVANMKNVYVNSLVPQLDSVLNGMSRMLGDVTNILGSLNEAMNDMGVIFDGVETTVADTTESLEQIKAVIDNVSGRLTELLERLETLLADPALN